MPAAAGLVVTAMPAAPAALPVACSTPCTVSASGQTGYVPAFTDLVSGSTVSWFTNEGNTHPTTEGVTTAAPVCFDALVTTERPSPPVRFDITPGGLTATTAATGTQPCTSAVALPDASYQLFYHCRLHPNMIGVLRVE